MTEIGHLFRSGKCRKMRSCNVVHDLKSERQRIKHTAHSLSRLAHGRRPVAISRIQHPRDQISSAPRRPLSDPVMTKVRKITICRTFRRHVHWCPCHTVQICSGHGHSGLGLPLLCKDFGGSKIGKFDITNSVKEDV